MKKDEDELEPSGDGTAPSDLNFAENQNKLFAQQTLERYVNKLRRSVRSNQQTDEGDQVKVCALLSYAYIIQI